MKRIVFLLCFGIFSICVSGQEKLTFKEFVKNSISEKTYTIEDVESLVSTNSYYYSLLLNKSVRYRMFYDILNNSLDSGGKKCPEMSDYFEKYKVLISNKFSEGNNNSNYLFQIAKKKELNFEQKYLNILKQNKAVFSQIDNYSSDVCQDFMLKIKSMSDGVYEDDIYVKNSISFNYITNPEDEIKVDYRIYSSLEYAPYENFFFTLKIPFSWEISKKKDFHKKSTIGSFQSNDKFLNGIITITLLDTLVSEVEVKKQDVTNKEMLYSLYEDNELLSEILGDIKNSKLTFFDYGNVAYILRLFNKDLGKSNEILDGVEIKTLQAITFKNGKLIILSFSAESIEYYNYYSKLFYKVLTSLKFNDIKSNVIYLKEHQGMKYIEVSFKDVHYDFMLDTGADLIVINNTILRDLLQKGIITESDYVGVSKAKIANGELISTKMYKVPLMRIGGKEVREVIINVVDSKEATPLLGMEGLRKLRVLNLNLNDNEIILKE